MLVIIGSDGNSLESTIAKRFGQANFYLLYDSETNSFKVFDNKGEGHNHKILEGFLGKGVEAFIVGNIGPHAFEIINTSKSKAYLARKMNVSDSIKKLLNEELEPLTNPTINKSPGHKHKHHNSGHNHHMQ